MRKYVRVWLMLNEIELSWGALIIGVVLLSYFARI
jgi:hypothetical protein